MKSLLAQLPLLKQVITDYRVLITLVGFILVIMIAGGVVNYTKKPPRPKTKKETKAPAPQQTEETGEDGEKEETQSDDMDE